MSEEPTITVVGEDDLSTDAIVAFPDSSFARDNAWLTLETGAGRPYYSLNIIRTDEGIVLDLYVLDKEDEAPVATTYVFDAEAVGA